MAGLPVWINPPRAYDIVTDKYNLFHHRFNTVCHCIAYRYTCQTQHVDIMASV